MSSLQPAVNWGQQPALTLIQLWLRSDQRNPGSSPHRCVKLKVLVQLLVFQWFSVSSFKLIRRRRRKTVTKATGEFDVSPASRWLVLLFLLITRSFLFFYWTRVSSFHVINSENPWSYCAQWMSWRRRSCIWNRHESQETVVFPTHWHLNWSKPHFILNLRAHEVCWSGNNETFCRDES